MSYTREDFEKLSQHIKAQGSGDSRKGNCLAHDDRTPSLDITWTGEKLIWHCHGGCSQDKVQEAIDSLLGKTHRSSSHRPIQDNSKPILPIDQINAISREILDCLPPFIDTPDLDRRGLKQNQIDELKSLGYRPMTLKSKRKVLKRLKDKYDRETLLGYPGYFVNSDGYETIGGQPGYIIPMRNWKGKIFSLLDRPDTPKYGKYQQLTSTGDKRGNGPGPLTQLHFTYPDKAIEYIKQHKTFIVTEGILKTDIANLFSAIPIAGIHGVNKWKDVIGFIKESDLEIDSVIIAFDADKAEKTNVANAQQSLTEGLWAHGYEVKIAEWTGPKGIDDLLISKGTYTLIEGDGLNKSHIEETVTSAKKHEAAKQKEKILAPFLPFDELTQKVKDDPGWLFIGDHLEKLFEIQEKQADDFNRIKAALTKSGGMTRGDLKEALQRQAKETKSKKTQRQAPAPAVTYDNKTNQSRSSDAAGKPEIETGNRQLGELSQECLELLKAENQKTKTRFSMKGQFVYIDVSESGKAEIQRIDRILVKTQLCEIARFIKTTEKGKRNVYLDNTACDTILAKVKGQFPSLEGLIQSPVVRPDGTIITKPGYDQATRLYYHPADGLTIEDIPESPTREDVRQAVEYINYLIDDFPFIDQASRANAIALMLTPLMRPAIAGDIPIGLIDATKQGSGKSLLAKVISTIVTGSESGFITKSKQEDETRKALTSLFKKGSTFICLDNLDHELDSAVLARAVTSSVWEDRELQQTNFLEYPQNATFCVTGNNIQVGNEFTRRCYWVKIDTQSPHPWKGRTFKIHDILGHVRKHRGHILKNLLVIIRYYFAQGCPRANFETIGGFEAWSTMLSGCLATAGIPEFMGNQDEMIHEMGTDQQWERWLEHWHINVRQEKVSVSDLINLYKEEYWAEYLPDEISRDLTGPSPTRSAKTRVGMALRSRKRTVFGKYRLFSDYSKERKINVWYVDEQKSTGPIAQSTGPNSEITGPIESRSRNENTNKNNSISNKYGTYGTLNNSYAQEKEKKEKTQENNLFFSNNGDEKGPGSRRSREGAENLQRENRKPLVYSSVVDDPENETYL